jgi:cysteine-rich repeat protein
VRSQIVGLLIAGLAAAPPVWAGERALVAANARLARMAARLVAVHERVAARCAGELLRCAGSEAAGCSDAASRRCRHRLDRLARLAARAARAGNQVGGRLGGALLDPEEGLGYALLAPLCAAAVNDAGSALACQHASLECTADRAVGVLAPRVAPVLSSTAAMTCVATSMCGDGVVDDTEECDDGAANSDVLPDRCRRSCRDPDCGDGVVDEDEACDDRNAIDGDGCDADCESEADACGNGVLDEDEACDDGNAVDGDGCDEDCSTDTSVCGDGIESDDEECDEGPANSDVLPDHCRATCRLPWCGDGVVDPDEGEECDPPGTLLCTSACESRIALPLGRDTVAPNALDRCGRAIVRRGARLFVRTGMAIGGCVRAAARCVLHDDATDRCAVAAAERCGRAAARRDRLTAEMGASAGRACGLAVPLSMLLDPEVGLGFRDVAALCPFDAATPPSSADLLRCVAARLACLGERAAGSMVPRAYDALSEVVDDPDTEFPCVLDLDELRGSPSAAFLDQPRR